MRKYLIVKNLYNYKTNVKYKLSTISSILLMGFKIKGYTVQKDPDDTWEARTRIIRRIKKTMKIRLRSIEKR